MRSDLVTGDDMLKTLLRSGAVAVLLLATTTVTDAAAAPVSDFKGVNWADPRDNYASDAVVPSGLAVTDDYGTVYGIAQRMVAGFRQNLGASTLRLPINPASVGTTWWQSYRGAIDAATKGGDKVI